MFTRRDALLFAGALSLGGAYAFWPRTQGNPDNTLFDLSAQAQEVDAPLPSVQDYSLGDPDAPVKIVEYASFTCPHCANFHKDTFKAFKAQFIDTGKVHFTYREAYFDRYGLWAGMVARCAGQERYFGMLDLIYANQREWARGSDPATVAANLRKLGLEAGMSGESLDACMQDAAMAQALVAHYQENATRDGLTSTPSFMVNGTMHSGNLPLARLEELISEQM